ncbi:hypothetical protein Y10_29950 [Neptunitalea sp. Y10]|uniref:Uncharacterized protein n=2 Tax=Neptunitalea lumnitzerae TaxID=2965509 RepID=A0ABQ5MMK6_9FLAO|nr:hypothetical protein Y10_29950 [Neptunitalea sp. Y10]
MSAQDCRTLYSDGHSYYTKAYENYKEGITLYNKTKKRVNGLATKLAYGEDIDDEVKAICNDFDKVLDYYNSAQYYLTEKAFPKLRSAKNTCSGSDRNIVQKLITTCEALTDEIDERKSNIAAFKEMYGICE